MTSMIDVTLQLIVLLTRETFAPRDDLRQRVSCERRASPSRLTGFARAGFFLVANDLSRREIVDLVLPVALHAESDDPVPEGRVVVNIRHPADPEQSLPVVSIAGRDVPWRDLARTLHGMLDARRAHGGGPAPDATALVRADTTTPWRHVQLVLQACAEPRIAIRRIQFATTRGQDGSTRTGE